MGFYLISRALRWHDDSGVISLQSYSCRWISACLPLRGWLARRLTMWVGVPVRRGFMTLLIKVHLWPQTTISPPGLLGLAAGHSVAPVLNGSPKLCSDEDQAKLTPKLMSCVSEWTSLVITHIPPATVPPIKQWIC